MEKKKHSNITVADFINMIEVIDIDKKVSQRDGFGFAPIRIITGINSQKDIDRANRIIKAAVWN